MAPTDDMERAYARYLTLLRLIEMEMSRAKSGPTADRYLALGMTDVGDKPAAAQGKIDKRLCEIQDLVEHLAVLDIAAAFELSFRRKVSNAIGDARDAVRRQRQKEGKNPSTPALVRDIEEMRGLASIKSILSPGLSPEVRDSMERIRKCRNDFAHGTVLSTLPAISAKDTLDCLLDVFGSF